MTYFATSWQWYMPYLGKNITKGPANKGSKCLGGQWILIKGIIVGGPARDSASADNGSLTEQRAIKGGILTEWRSGNTGDILGDRCNSEGRSGEAGGGNYETEKLHCPRRRLQNEVLKLRGLRSLLEWQTLSTRTSIRLPTYSTRSTRRREG
jgi:hypothetical protein